jgi:diguanylate cyclase (GGDEF)-like protein/PAS domain S-box-containing protein
MALQEPIRVLIVEDVRTDAEIEVRELKRAGLRVEHLVVETEAGFRRALAEFVPHLIISDFSMPHFDGMAALALARELRPALPFLFVSGTIGEEYAIRALKNGATDYVLKTNLVRLPAAIERALQEAREHETRRATERALEETRERLQSIFESLPDALWSVSLPGEQILYMSPAAAAVFGRSAEALLRSETLWTDVVHEEDRPAVAAAWKRLLEGGAYDVEYRVVHPEGAIGWIHDRGRLIRDENGVATRVDGLARDVSDLVRQRVRLARLGRIRDLLGAVNSACMRMRDRDSLFEEFCRIANVTGGFVLARMLALDGAGRLVVAASTAPLTAALEAVIGAFNRDPAGADSPIASAMRSGQPVVANDLPQQDDASSAVILPVRVEGKVAAAAVLHARGLGAFDQEELALLSEMVGNLEFALELQAKQERVNYLALYDPLTGLANRALFRERLTQALEAARRANGPLALALVDLERFKAINDTVGQGAGDRLLREAGARLQAAAGDAGRVARLGGNLFAVMFADIAGAGEVARRIEQNVGQVFGLPYLVEGKEIRLAAKAGVVVYPEDGPDEDALLRNAEAALNRAKRTGDRYLFYAPQLNARISEQVELEHRVRRAVEQRELFLHYQPKVDLITRRIVGVEALMRWLGPDGVFVSPARFIPILEETGLILEAGRQALAMAAETHRDWKVRMPEAPRIAVNVSALQIRHKSFVEDVRTVVDAAEVGIDLEITETLLMEDVESSIRKLNAVREAGLCIALDDFGTGHSSLAYLSRLPIDTIKIDRSFVRGMVEKAEDTSIVTAIISLAQALRLSIVAEGVETEEQARLLRLLRCDQMQGYLFSRPLPKDRIDLLLAGTGA